MKSIYRCPSCNNLLCVDFHNGLFVLWCGHGPCPSYAANDGAEGATEAGAFGLLERKIDNEPEPEREPETEDERKDRIAWEIADRKVDEHKLRE